MPMSLYCTICIDTIYTVQMATVFDSIAIQLLAMADLLPPSSSSFFFQQTHTETRIALIKKERRFVLSSSINTYTRTVVQYQHCTARTQLTSGRGLEAPAADVSFCSLTTTWRWGLWHSRHTCFHCFPFLSMRTHSFFRFSLVSFA